MGNCPSPSDSGTIDCWLSLWVDCALMRADGSSPVEHAETSDQKLNQILPGLPRR
ncbi:hypothetical protein GCM10027060_21930 [Nesterenkonia halophila]